MKQAINLFTFSLTIIFYMSCQPPRTIPDVIEKAYLKATLSDTSDTIKVNVPLTFSLTIPAQIHTLSNTTYTLTKKNVNLQAGFLLASKDNEDTTGGNSLHAYNGFYENGEWKSKIYFNAASSYPNTYYGVFTPKDTGLYYLSFDYPIDIELKDGDKQIAITAFTDFDVTNKHQELITSKYQTWDFYINKLNSQKVGFYAFYVK